MVNITSYTKVAKLGPSESTFEHIIIKPQKHQDYWSTQERKTWMFGVASGCMATYSARVALPICAVKISEELDLTKEEQGVVLGCFFWGYVMTQILGGVLADKYGGERVMTVSGLIWSLATFSHPILLSFADTSSHQVKLYLLIVLRVVTGFFQGVHFPCISSLLTQRIAKEDRSFFWGIISASTGFGMLTMGSLGSYILDTFGWQFVFYFCGFMSLSWVAFVGLYLLRWHQNLSFSTLLSYITSFKENNGPILPKHSNTTNSILHSPSRKVEFSNAKPPESSVPWSLLLTHPAVWALIVCHVVSTNCFYILLSWLPTFFHEQYPDAKGHVFNVVPWLAYIPLCIFSGWLSDKLISSGVSTSKVRKGAEFVALVGSGLVLIFIPLIKEYHVSLFLVSLTLALFSCHAGGHNSNCQDLVPEHAGSLFGVMNTAGAIPGFVGVYMTGFILHLSNGNWEAVFATTSIICISGWIFYAVFGKGNRIS